MRRDPLLEAIFQPGEESIRAGLRALRRRRFRRLILPLVANAACLATIVSVLLILQSKPPAVVNASPVLRTVHSRPLTSSELVRTAQKSVEIVSTSETGTTPPGIADSELLASFHAGHASLIVVGEERRLIEF